MIELVSKVPMFVWVIGIGTVLLMAVVTIALVLYVIKRLQREKGRKIVKFARTAVSKGVSQVREAITDEEDPKAVTRNYIGRMKSNGMSDLQIKEQVEALLKE